MIYYSWLWNNEDVTKIIAIRGTEAIAIIKTITVVAIIQ